MPVINNIQKVAQAKGFKNALELAKAADLSQGTVYPLWNRKVTRIDFSTLEKLCKTLDAPVGVLLEYHPGAGEEV
jgi:DNA-binding Xre family transcriptional regulator